MPSFIIPKSVYFYRPLKATEPKLIGWDVWALQHAINEYISQGSIVVDGFFGETTKQAVVKVQEGLDLSPVDGIAGVATQDRLNRWICRQVEKEVTVYPKLLYSQTKHESSSLFGNHSAWYSGSNSQDHGVSQMNDRFWDLEVAYNPSVAVKKLANHLLGKYNQYKSLGNSVQKSWELASGSWNAPSVTDTLARGGTVSSYWYTHINNYIEKATKEVEW